MDKDYEMNINVYNKSVPIFAPSNTWYKGKINKNLQFPPFAKGGHLRGNEHGRKR